MASIPDLELEFPAVNGTACETKHFLNFLRRAGRKYSVTISICESQAGIVTLAVPGTECWNLDVLLQELVFGQGLYYYLCTIPNRRHIARTVVKPIFEELLLSRYSVVYPVLIQKHLMDGASDWIGGAFSEGTAQRYEMLFHRFRLKKLSGYEFIRDLDDLLTEFMLMQLEHPKGVQSPKFNILVDRCGKEDVLRDKSVRKLFNKVHALRTHGLHRLEREIPDGELAEIAQSIHNVFEWLDDYWEAQDEKTVKFSGRRYRRVRYGQEITIWKRQPGWKEHHAEGIEQWWATYPCHDCSVIRGELHLDGCDVEVCPRCAGQYMCCDCRCRAEEEEDR